MPKGRRDCESRGAGGGGAKMAADPGLWVGPLGLNCSDMGGAALGLRACLVAGWGAGPQPAVVAESSPPGRKIKGLGLGLEPLPIPVTVR